MSKRDIVTEGPRSSGGETQKTEDIAAVNTEENIAISTEENEAMNAEEIDEMSTEDNSVASTEESDAMNAEENDAVNAEENEAVNAGENDEVSIEENSVASIEENSDMNIEVNGIMSPEEIDDLSMGEDSVASIEENGDINAEVNGTMSTDENSATSTEENDAMSFDEYDAMSAEENDEVSIEENDAVNAEENNAENAGENNAENAGENNSGNSGENSSGNSGENNSGNSGENNSGNSGENNSGNSGENNAGNAEENGAGNAEENDAGNAEENDAVNVEENGVVNAEENGAINAEEIGAVNGEGNGAMNAEENDAGNAEENDAVNVEENGAVNAEENGAINAEEIGAVNGEGNGAMNAERINTVKYRRNNAAEKKGDARRFRREAPGMRWERVENFQGCSGGRGGRASRGRKGGRENKDFTFHFDDDLGRLDNFQLDLENELDDIADEAINAEPRYKYSDDENKSFREIAATMENVDEDGYIKKKIIAEGSGEKPPPFARALIHYDFYKESFEEPFDSTYLRSKPCKIRLDESEVIPGLEMAVKSMRKKESAKFIFKHEVAFGIQGCPPRIPKRCTVLAYVELVDFTSLVDKKEDLQFSNGEYRLNSFARGYKDAKATHIEGNEEFSARNIKSAVRCYRRCIAMLNELKLGSADEEKRMFCLKIKCLVNLSICYNRLNKPEQACVVARQALALDENNPKALYQYGKANLILSNLDLAEKWLRKAYNLKPDDVDVLRELGKLNERKDRAKALDNLFCKRAFRFYDDEKDGKNDKGEEDENVGKGQKDEKGDEGDKGEGSNNAEGGAQKGEKQ